MLGKTLRALLIFSFVLLLLDLTACATLTSVPTAAPAPTNTHPLPPSTFTPTVPPTDTPTPKATATVTNTPTPTATLAPAEVVLNDDFSAPCKLLVVDNDTIKAGCQNGEFVMLIKKDRYREWSYYPNSKYDNFIVEVDARVVSNTPNLAYGLIVRVNGHDFRLFEVTNNGIYYAAREGGDKPISLLTTQTAVSAIKPNGNHLKVIAQGDRFAFYVNDRFINTVADSGPSAGSVGIYLGSGFAGAQVAFDHFKVTKINRPLSMPAPIPTPAVAQPAPTQPGAQPTAEQKYPLPPGQGGLVLQNSYTSDMTFTVNNQQYTVPANGETFIVLDPGDYSWSVIIPGKDQASGTGTVHVIAGAIRLLQFVVR